YLPFHRKLADYYRETENFTAALNHLTYLSDNSINNDDLLLEAGDLCLHDLNRPDKALQYFERYRRQNPQDQQVMKIISDIQSTMANDFISIVENDGATQLWRDLVEVAPNRQAIYLDMAAKLEEQGKIPEVIEILTIIHDNSPHNDQVALRLGRWLYFLHQYDRVLDILDTVSGQKRSKDFYLLKGNSEKKIGREMVAFSSLAAALRLDPQDTGLRIACLDLAGRTGMVDKMLALFNDGLKFYDDQLPYELVATQLGGLAYNFLFAEYAKIHKLAVERYATNREILSKLTVQLAKTMRRSGDSRRAEQLLRELLNGEQLIGEVLFTLAGDAIDDRNFEAAEVWQTALQQRTAGQKETFFSGVTDIRLLLLKLRTLRTKGDYGQALALLQNFTKNSGQITEEDIGASLLFRLKKEQCLLHYYNG
ncbi:MAG: tetratricopeptide repeat protein, partial [Desulforhopalus sp.]